MALLALACAGPADEPPIDVRVEWGLTGSSLLPSSIDTIRVLTCTVDAETGAEACVPTNCSVAGLTGMTESESCHPTMGTEAFGDEPVLVRRNLPTGTPIRFLLEGQDIDGNVTHTGQAGPFILGEGERRQVTLRMWTVGEGSALPGESIGRFLHTTTWLPDGRLLVAGGFDTIVPGTCPADLVLPEGTQCFRATATDEAIAIEIGSGRVEPIRSAMLAARGGHTATTLPDGRVLLVGGATEALVVFAPMGGMDSGRYAIQVLPRDAMGDSTAHASFEVFDAFLGHRTDDPDRDGDPGRGGFLGVGGTDTPGATNQPRFLHAAAAVPSTAGRVVVAGGLGGPNSASSFEVFDADKPGGYGFHRAAGTNVLGTARVAPSAIGLRGQVWIFGGALAADNTELAEVWEAEDDANGAVRDATTDSSFPSDVVGTPEDHPEYALIRPAVASVESGDAALVVGWYGAQCEPMMSVERFFDPATTTELCNSPMSPATRSFTVTADTGITVPTDSRPQAFAEVAITEDFDPNREGFRRRVLVLGGIANSTWSPQRSAEVFTGGVDASGEASKLTGAGVTLANGRVFHSATGVPGLGVVTVGGAEFTARGGLRLVDAVELFWLAQ